MRHYYKDDAVTIYHGDCLEVIPDLGLKYDLVVTDPPYGLSYNNGDLAHNREKVFGGDTSKSAARPIANDKTEEEADRLFRAMLFLMKNGLLKGGACCCCCGGGGPKPLFAKWSLFMDEIIGFKHAVVWDKGGLGMGMHFRRNYEFILIAQNGQPAHRWNGGNNTPNVWRINKIIPNKDQHPTEKPVKLASKIITIFSNPGDLVIDPFMGTGWTMQSAKELGRKAIGIELEEKYCEIAANRCRQEMIDFK